MRRKVVNAIITYNMDLICYFNYSQSLLLLSVSHVSVFFVPHNADYVVFIILFCFFFGTEI